VLSSVQLTAKVSCSSDCPFQERLQAARRFFLFLRVSPGKSRRCQGASVLEHLFIVCSLVSFLSSDMHSYVISCR